MKREVKNRLRHTVCKAEEHRLEAQYRLHLSMREDFTDLLGLESGLRKICIIDNDAFDIRFCCCLAAHTRIQLSENRVDYTSPIDVAVVHDTIEQYSDNHRIIKHFSLFYYIILALARLEDLICEKF